MRRNSSSRQPQTQICDRRVFLLLSALAAAAAADWFLFSGSTAPRAGVPIKVAPPRQSVAADPEGSHSESFSAYSRFPPSPDRAEGPVEPPPSISLLEAQFRAAQGKEDRMDLARQIADLNDAGAIESIGRLFALERHPDIKLALITDLNDMDSEAAPAARLAILSSALGGDQPRNIRAAALDSLANIEDPRVEAILKQAMSGDPDHEVRDQAAAIYRARYLDSAQ